MSYGEEIHVIFFDLLLVYITIDEKIKPVAINGTALYNNLEPYGVMEYMRGMYAHDGEKVWRWYLWYKRHFVAVQSTTVV